MLLHNIAEETFNLLKKMEIGEVVLRCVHRVGRITGKRTMRKQRRATVSIQKSCLGEGVRKNGLTT